MDRLSIFKDRHAGQRCILVCNGPSLNGMELSVLRHEVVIGLNKIHLGMDRFRFYPRYLVAVNDRVVAQSREALQKLNCVKFISRRNSPTISEDGLTHFIETATPKKRFCTDIREGVHEGWTVTYAALQIAYHMGFQEVFIIGMDHRYVYRGAPNEARVLKGTDPNHFDPQYFGGGQEWNNPDLDRSEESYRIARREFEQAGRRIYDATDGGACNVFEKIDHRAVFGEAA
ncbi:MAG: 6-hydroxymethylpterin diphosphokinase MptE-like protein [Pseudomonadota bacterium]